MILVSGETVIDLFSETAPDGATVFRPVEGGSPFNMAIGCARLGAPTAFLWALSTDIFGKRFRAALEKSGLVLDWALETSRNSTLSFVDLSSGSPAYTFLDEGSAGRLFDPAEAPPIDDRATLLHVGSYVLGTEPVGARLEALVAREASRRLISLDINVRPSLVTDAETYKARLSHIVSLASIVKASDEDLAWLMPGRSPLEVAEGWIAGGAALAIVTLGAKGSLIVCREAVAERPTKATKIVDTVGAGDAFMAGILSGLERRGFLTRAALDGLSLSDITSLADEASTIAAIVCSRRGPDMPWKNEVPGL
ncbi:carbohydrate kinase family protein [Segnochrobactrum spirostomi]|nr:carbohydrate kinase [Segnochrobactrum spirostomi]